MLSAMGIDIASVDGYMPIIHSSVEDFGGCINPFKMLKSFSVF